MKRLAVCLAVVAVSSPWPALAGKAKGKGKPHDPGGAVIFTVSQRETVRTYFTGKHGRGGCPPGLAKKRNGCLPPGQAKKRYVLGHPLPRGVLVDAVPADLAVLIGPPPAGYIYGILDGDLLKLAAGTLLVVDAIDALVD
jgi:hypothetical protein